MPNSKRDNDFAKMIAEDQIDTIKISTSALDLQLIG